MSLSFRVIARLDIKGPNLVKGIQLEGLRVLGKPENFAKYYYEQGIDEIIFQDVVASLYGRNNLHNIISKTAKEIFIPLTVGGGIRYIEDIYNILRAGADKVSINTAAVNNPKFISEAVKIFGSSTIVISIEAIKQPDKTYKVFTNNGRDNTGLEVIAWARKIEELGAGEILITLVDNEGMGNGLNIELLQNVSEKVSIPIVAHGGVGRVSHVQELLQKVSLSGVAIASLFHYDYLNNNFIIDYHQNEGNIDFLKKKKVPPNFQTSSIKDLKYILIKNKINCRLVN